MRKLSFTLAATMLLAAPSIAQSPETSIDAVPGVSPERSIGATIRHHLNGNVSPAVSDAIYNGSKAFWQNCGPTSTAPSLWDWIKQCGLLEDGQAIKPLRYSQQNAKKHQFGGAGASGGWEGVGRDLCEDFIIRPTGDGYIEISSIPLAGGGPLPRAAGSAQTSKFFYKPITWEGNAAGTNHIAYSPMALALYSAHKKNMVRPKASWYGAYEVVTYPTQNSLTFRFTTRRYLRSDGYLVRSESAQAADLISFNETNYTNANGWRSCPLDQSGGGGFDFYLANKDCIWYAKNYALGPTGYAYAPSVELEAADLAGWPSDATAAYYGCDIDPDFIADVAEDVIEKVCEDDPTSPACDVPPDPVPQSCGGDVSNLRGTSSVTKSIDCPEEPTPPTDPPPPPDPTDPGEGSGGDGAPDGWYDPAPTGDVNIPDFGLEMPDWWPNLPTLDFSSATCPTYQLDLNGFFGETFVVDSHCPIIADFRSTIAAIMLVCWTMAAAVIVMRA